MPTKRFSTRSTRPMPLSWPSSFSAFKQRRRDRAFAVDGNGIALLEADLDGRSPYRALPWATSCAGRRSRAAFDPGPPAPCPPMTNAEGWRRPRTAPRPPCPWRSGSGALRAKSRSSVRPLKCPFAPGRDDADVGLERVIGKLEPDLVVALAGGAVGDRIGANLSARSRSASSRSAGARWTCRADRRPHRRAFARNIGKT